MKSLEQVFAPTEIEAVVKRLEISACTRFGFHHADFVKDLVQNALITTWKQLREHPELLADLSDPGRFDSYVFRCVINGFLSSVRVSRPTTNQMAVIEGQPLKKYSLLLHSEAIDIVNRVVSTAGDCEKKALQIICLFPRDREAIAAELGVSTRTVSRWWTDYAPLLKKHVEAVIDNRDKDAWETFGEALVAIRLA